MALNNIATELSDITRQYTSLFSAISDKELSAKPNSVKWSKKEVIGHLIDSSQNNLRRFITSQYESSPPHIIYAQDSWVVANQLMAGAGLCNTPETPYKLDHSWVF